MNGAAGAPAEKAAKGRLLNLGCGSRHHPALVNLDFVGRGDAVTGCDLLMGIPFADQSFEAVYHSHLLEHFSKEHAPVFLAECFRVLRPAGIIRIAVPDLEKLAREYLRCLEAAAAGSKAEELNYEWMMIHLYDQTVREQPGGEMGAWLRREPVPNRDYVLKWIGVEGERIIEQAARERQQPQATPPRTARQRLSQLAAPLRDWAIIREWLIQRLLGSEYQRLQVGRLRSLGGIHKWMYDRHSLAQLLKEAGFSQTQVVGPVNSRIPNWATYNLDTEPDGRVFHPDSLFMEAVKP